MGQTAQYKYPFTDVDNLCEDACPCMNSCNTWQVMLLRVCSLLPLPTQQACCQHVPLNPAVSVLWHSRMRAQSSAATSQHMLGAIQLSGCLPPSLPLSIKLSVSLPLSVCLSIQLSPSLPVSHLVLAGQRPLGALSLTPQLLQCTHVLGDVCLVLLLDELDEVLHHTLVKVLTWRGEWWVR